MPRRYDYDPEEFDDEDGDEGSPEWRQRLITWGLAAVALGLGFMIPYVLYLNHQVTLRFGELRWQVPTRVYGRPLDLSPGLAMDAATLKTELDAASYHEDATAKAPGSYVRNGGRFVISNRGFIDVDGKVPARRIEVTLSGSRVAGLRDASTKKSLRAARLDPAARELDEYFAGARRQFDIALDWRLSAGFRSTVLHHLPEIGYGHTASYAAVARLAGNPKAVRAVGTACATNPLPVVVPCHRVLRSDGTTSTTSPFPPAVAAALAGQASAHAAHPRPPQAGRAVARLDGQ